MFLVLGRREEYGRHAELAIEHGCSGPQDGDGVAFTDAAVIQGRSERTAAVAAFLACIVLATLNDGDAFRIDECHALEKVHR